MSIKTVLVVQWATGVARIAVTSFLFIIFDLFSWKYWFVKIGASLSSNY